MITDLNTFLRKAVPDTKLTIKKYLDVKFEYLSYCLKVKEMDDEEYGFAMVQEPLYRVETGNYEYRLVLRCRQDARTRFAKMRNDVLVKLELLDNKHVQDIVFQLQRFIDAMATYHDQCYGVMKQIKIFPLEVDLARDAFAYNLGVFNTGEDEGDNGSDEDGGNTVSAEENAGNNNKYSQLADDVKLIDLAGLSTKRQFSDSQDDEVLDMNNWNSVSSTWSSCTADDKSNKQETVTDLLCFD
ncbi:unnamed protein product [Trichobilharzia szidati]|nr:unnamed protein product [Trichobilharzia szidati]